MENGYKTKSKEKEFYLKIMGIFMMEIGMMISLMVKEYSSSKMGKNMMEKSKVINLKDMGSIIMQTKLSIKEIGMII
jgi:hypothetical protein